MATLVKFRKEVGGDFDGEITAIFPKLKWGIVNPTIAAYAHNGQHTGASKEWIKAHTIAATESEYMDLKCELESIGYDLKICK